MATPQLPPLMFRGPAGTLVVVIDSSIGALFTALMGMAMIVLLRVLLRRTWAALSVYWIVALFLYYPPPSAGSMVLYLAVSSVFATITLFVLFRVGLLAWAATTFVLFLVGHPITLDFSRWYASHGLVLMAAAVAFAVYGFRLSLAGRPLFGASALDD